MGSQARTKPRLNFGVDGRTDLQTDRLNDQPTDTLSYRLASSRLMSEDSNLTVFFGVFFSYETLYLMTLNVDQASDDQVVHEPVRVGEIKLLMNILIKKSVKQPKSLTNDHCTVPTNKPCLCQKKVSTCPACEYCNRSY